MRCGYFAMPLHPPGAAPAQTMEEDLEQLVTLERLGFEEAWIGEHFTAAWENIWIVGDPDEVTEKLNTLRHDVGGFGTLLVIAHEWQPREAWVHSMTLLMEEVLPRF